jgi:hypothetical protein
MGFETRDYTAKWGRRRILRCSWRGRGIAGWAFAVQRGFGVRRCGSGVAGRRQIGCGKTVAP